MLCARGPALSNSRTCGPAVSKSRTPRPAADLGAEDSLCARGPAVGNSRTCGRQFTDLRSAIRARRILRRTSVRKIRFVPAFFYCRLGNLYLAAECCFPAPQRRKIMLRTAHGASRETTAAAMDVASCGKGKRRPFQNAPSTIFANCQVRILPCSLSVFVVAKKRAILYNRKNGVVWVGGRSALPRGRLIPPLTRKGENA